MQCLHTRFDGHMYNTSVSNVAPLCWATMVSPPCMVSERLEHMQQRSTIMPPCIQPRSQALPTGILLVTKSQSERGNEASQLTFNQNISLIVYIPINKCTKVKQQLVSIVVKLKTITVRALCTSTGGHNHILQQFNNQLTAYFHKHMQTLSGMYGTVWLN